MEFQEEIVVLLRDIQNVVAYMKQKLDLLAGRPSPGESVYDDPPAEPVTKAQADAWAAKYPTRSVRYELDENLDRWAVFSTPKRTMPNAPPTIIKRRIAG